MPWDRVWAVPHSKAKTDGGAWVSCKNFTRGAGYPSLMAIDSKLHEATETIRLTHPDLPDFSFNPDSEASAFVEWISPILPASRPAPTGVLRALGQGMTDQSKPWISILNLASLRDLGEKLGAHLDPRRFRGNIWIDGLPAWAERDWIGKNISMGSTSLEVMEPITRCRATEVDPETGDRNVDTLAALFKNWGHRDFGVFARVSQSGNVDVGDKFEVSL